MDFNMNPSSFEVGKRVKALVVATPVLGAAARALVRVPLIKDLRGLRHRFRNSSSYWEQRYRRGGSSGPGSSGRLAEFKAETLNTFVERNGIRSIIEFGCGDGAQLALARYPRYVGIDIANSSIAACCRRFTGDTTKSFFQTQKMAADLGRFDLALSLDVVYHLVEDQVFDAYMRSLFAHAGRFVAIYSSNKVEPSDAPHIRHRLFTTWINILEPQWRKIGCLPNKYPYDPVRPADTSFSDFYFFEKL
jgi:Methyltransferase domain